MENVCCTYLFIRRYIWKLIWLTYKPFFGPTVRIRVAMFVASQMKKKKKERKQLHIFSDALT